MNRPGKAKRHERNHPGRRPRHPAASHHPGDVQAAASGLRQAHDLLPALHPDAGRHPRHPDHLHAGRPAALPGPAGRRRPAGGALFLPGPGTAARPGRRFPGRRGIHRRRPRLPDPGRQYFLRPGPDRDAAPGRGRRRCRRGDRLRLRGQGPRALRRGGDRRRGQGRFHRGEARPARVPTWPWSVSISTIATSWPSPVR